MSQEHKTLIVQRNKIEAQMGRFIEYFEDIRLSDTTEDIISQLELRLSKFEPCFEEYDNIQLKIEISYDDETPLAELSKRGTFEARYFEFVSGVKHFISKFHTSRQNDENDIVSTNGHVITNSKYEPPQVKLPIINLPVFTGAYSQWLEFRDSFKALIHENQTLSNIQRYYYLKSSLDGDAKQLLESITVSADNYDIAWDMLCERFQNKKLIIRNHLKSIFEIQPIQKESHVKLRQLYDNVTRNLRAINSLGIKTDEWDIIIIYIIMSKFDKNTLRQWESFEITDELPTMADINKFLKKQCEMLEHVEINKFQSNETKYKIHSNTFVSTKQQTNSTCLICHASHSVYKCPEFRHLLIQDRINKIKGLGACLNCLRTNHSIKDCKSLGCFKCGKKHHTLLHVNNTQNNKHVEHAQAESKGTPRDIASTSKYTNVMCSINNTYPQVILATAMVRVYDQNGRSYTCRALLDCASQSTIITNKLAEKLGLHKTRARLSISGISESTAKVHFQTAVLITSLDGSFKREINALILPKISEPLPSYSFDDSCIDVPSNIKLADPTYNKKGSIDILLGANVYWDLIGDKTMHLGEDLPHLQSTNLGWIVGGMLNCNKQSKTQHTFLTLAKLNENVAKMWEIENCSVTKPHLTACELYCEEHFRRTTERNADGRFLVSIPFKDSLLELGESRHMALRRLYKIEERLSRDKQLKTQYDNFLREYLNLGHMSKVNEADSESQLTCYLPHHPVIKESSLTTKVRVVFDASAKTDSGLSLNDTQYVGPVVQNELFSILISFRLHTYILSGDIAMMYRQVLIKPEQRSLQRILWRFNPDEEVQCFELNTVSFGTASAPYLATRCLEQLAINYETSVPEISFIIRNHTYMDDVLTGAETVEDILKLQRQLTNVFASAGFELRKWQSNIPDPSQLSRDSRENLQYQYIDFNENQAAKTLGIHWDVKQDLIKFTLGTLESKSVTKRAILGKASQIFDPLGLLNPITITAKLIIQELWQKQIGWDDPVPHDIYQKWAQLCEDWKNIRMFEIPRHVTITNATSYEIHGFADASEKAYGACIYIRTKTNCKYVNKLLCSKSRVAPIKSISLPRLELCATQLLANLFHKVMKILSINCDGIYLWSDSTIALCWIKGSPNRWKTFVANRVAEIQSLTQICYWHHIRSADNPADLISRGMMANDKLKFKFWLQGPDWLSQGKLKWSEFNHTLENQASVDSESKVVSLVSVQNTFEIFSKFSSFIKLTRVTAYILRFSTNCKLASRNRIIGPLTGEEMMLSRNRLIRLAQQEHFDSDFNHLLKHGKLHKKSKLLTLNAFIDADGILRVGGRIEQANLVYDNIHPIILPANHHLTKLMITYEHLRLGHCGPQQLLAHIRQQYWPIRGRHLCKKITMQCVTCFKSKPRVLEQLMGNLPQARITPAPPFYNTGVDYAGPILIRDRKTRGSKLIKAYICLFVCLSTKAVHIEVVTDLTTEAFIATLRRFASRRGCPRNLYSDNGKNFVGSQREIKQLYNFLERESSLSEISDYLSKDYITWHFIPPRTANFGGVWEANIKIIKRHLNKIIGNSRLIYEELSTVLTQIEAILNSRPLTPLSQHPDDLEVLTPSHLLIGRKLTAVPDPTVQELPDNRLNRFQYMQKLQQQFWSRWSKEYLVELQQRYKWKHSQDNLKEGVMVLIRDDTTPPMSWKTGRVLQLHPGPDGLVRVATIKTSSGEVKRGLSNICVLPFEGNQS